MFGTLLKLIKVAVRNGEIVDMVLYIFLNTYDKNLCCVLTINNTKLFPVNGYINELIDTP